MNKPKLILKFNDLTKNDAELAGGKGASLGEMTRVGIPVPPGFVVLVQSFEQFIKETDLVQEIDSILDKVNHKEIHTVESASEKIKDLILSREMPEDIAQDIEKHFSELDTKYVAVRSSATAEDGAEHAWAGQLDSYLNVTQDNVLKKVQHCWASLFTPRAIFYRFEKGLHTTKISVAVVVQKMVNSEVSGIAFSVHPVTEDYNQLIIEAGFGLGEAIVSGSVTPDSYVVEKSPRRIIDVNVSSQERALYRLPEGGNEWRTIDEPHASSQVLNEDQILELSEIILHIENHYGFPCDIEWAYEAGKFYIVQSRPITTLSKKQPSQSKQTFVKAYTRNFSIIMQQAWFAANKENLVSKLELTEYPYDPPYLYYMKDGVEEVWENTKANRWLLDKVVEKFKSDTQFFPGVYKRYYDQLSEVEKWWKKDIKTVSELEKFIDKVYVGVSDFVILYSSLMDKEVPKEYQELANKFREKDVFFAECNTAIWKALNNIYPDLGYLAIYITREELGKDIDKEELKKRDAGFALIPGIFVGPVSFAELMNKFPDFKFEIEKGEQDENGLKGQSAYKGKAVGKVRIVKRKDQVDQLLEGEVMVSPMTTPDMVPAMKKAVAFVTDEGGITCHAAIIAREMQKPCIIGTKIATQLLKDGDTVEVDANNGIVKIIESSSMKSPQEYQRLFQVGGMPYIVSDIFMVEYSKLKAVVMLGHATWTSYLPKESIKQTLAEGRELYSNHKEFENYKSSFNSYKKESESYFEEILSKNVVTQEDIKTFLEYMENLFSYYRKTEFFATDDAYTYSLTDQTTKENLKQLELIKNSGREYLNKIFFGNSSYLAKLLDIVANQMNLDSENLKLYSRADLLALFEDKRVSQDDLDSRGKAYLMHGDGENLRYMKGLEAETIVSQFNKALHEVREEIKGKTANKGIVQGRAKIIIADYGNFDGLKKIMEEMENGDILIAETTSPELMPACSKASAIVTNQGGMMSHAAIVSRELNIPCIVGTGNATDLIKDGDMVEVNADRGIVRIIN